MEIHKQFTEGVLFYTCENRLYTLYKVLKCDSETGIFVRVYWPAPVCPEPGNLTSFDLRTSCEFILFELLNTPVFIGNDLVSETELEEYAAFIRIESGLKSRALEMDRLLKNADLLIAENRFDEAIAICTEAASFAKYNATIFDRRGWCYLETNRFREAITDFEHSLSISPENEETRLNCRVAYAKLNV